MDSGFAALRRPGMTKADIIPNVLYIPLARPRPGFRRFFGATMTERSSEGLDERRKKLLFRAWRRGVRETDLIVGRFADAHIEKLDENALDDFERLIEVPNSDLYAWVSGESDIPSDYDTAVLRQLKTFHARAKEER
jgi:antitoxin CptB